jgi:RNA polymerase sigma factor (sigma-70 family)
MSPPARPEEPRRAEARDRGADPAGHALVLRRGYAEGRAAHGPLALSFDAYARRAVDLAEKRLRRAGAAATREEVAEALSKAALADLYLAVACEEGAPGAWEAFTARFGPTLIAMAVRRGASRGEAEELAREIPGEIYAPPPGGGARTRLGTFDGSGSLAGWLAMIVHRRLVDRRRASAREAPSEAAIDGVAARPDADGDPAGAAGDAETARRFEEAFRAAWATLTPRESLAILLRFRDGLAQKEIARLLEVGEPRVSRILAGAADRIREAVGRIAGLRPEEEDLGSERLRAALRDVVAESLATGAPPSDPSTHG